MPSKRLDPYSLVIVDVPLDWAVNDIYHDLVHKYGNGVMEVGRMFYRDNQPMRSIYVKFDSPEQVEHLLDDGLMVIWHEIKKVKEYYFPIVCFVCGGIGHRSSACPLVKPCDTCQRRHDVGQKACHSGMS
ncbi:unnamed protein product, partial [Didymodactylos carnosus]